MKTIAVQCAKEIRKDLKENFEGIKFSVRSESFSLGNAVRISWFDGPLLKDVEALLEKYQYGHFDSMQDIYEYSNVIKGLPQVKYLLCERSMSNETRQNVYAGAEKAFNNMPDDTKRYLFDVDSFLWRVFNKVPMRAGEVGKEFVNTDITSGFIEDFYTINVGGRL